MDTTNNNDNSNDTVLSKDISQLAGNINDVNQDIRKIMNDIPKNRFVQDIWNLPKYIPKRNTTPDPNSDDDGNRFTFGKLFSYFFNQFNFLLIVWFLAIYLIIYIFLGLFTRTELPTDGLLISKVVDYITFTMLLVYGIHFYYSTSDKDKETWADFIYYVAVLLKTELKTFNTIFYVVFFLVFLYICVFLFSIPYGQEKPYSITVLENITWLYLASLIIIDCFTYILKIPIVDIIYKNCYEIWLSFTTCKAPPTTSPPTKKPVCYTFPPTTKPPTPIPTTTPPPNQEVFNVSNNLYSYDDAQNVCTALGATLASYEQIEAAYNDGAEWCNYGWSKDQMAYFPTQLDTWTEMQKNNQGKVNNNCGRPGINGGFMANPNLKFGVNCYGVKPPAKEVDLALMDANKNNVQPKTKEQAETDAKVKFWKENADKMLRINGHNKKVWSEY
jgi:hypothetical protein